jgi:hypothetical protein
VKPHTESAGYSHLPKTGLVRYAKHLHYLFKEMPQRIRRNTPDGTDYCTNQEGVKISVHRPMMVKQNFDINDNISEYEYGDVEPLSESKPEKPARSKMIWRNRHLNLGLKDNNGYTPLKYLLFCR